MATMTIQVPSFLQPTSDLFILLCYLHAEKAAKRSDTNDPWLTFRVSKVAVSVETAEVDRGVSHMTSFQCVWISLLCV